MSILASRRARLRSTSAFSASRTALVATARIGALWAAAMRCMRRSDEMPRSMASAESSFMSPPP